VGMQQAIRIPKARVKVLREVIDEIESKLSVKIEIRPDEILVGGESLDVWIALKIIKAIGRGFDPSVALKLLKEDYDLVVIDIMRFANTKNALIRLRGRVIGEKGRAKKYIEQLTDCHIQVYGKTVSIIGPLDKLDLARQAVEMLLNGAKHSTVYRFLEREKAKMRWEAWLQ